jgi:N6-adenosine-specific RNA methylase IME4
VKTDGLRVHEAAEFWPLLAGAELSMIVESMRKNGFDKSKPVLLWHGQVLDGRNRLAAAKLADVDVPTKELPSDSDPFIESWKHNGARRDVPEAQKVAICTQLKLASGRRLARDGDNQSQGLGRSADLPGRPITQAEIATDSGGSGPTVKRVLAVLAAAPALFAKIGTGELKANEALRQVKRKKLKGKGSFVPVGERKYRVLYADPPWKYSDERTGLADYSSTAAAEHYPTMSVEELVLSADKVKDISAKDAVFFCWATFPLLPDALEVVRAWGFIYKTAFVWNKVRPNFGHYHNASAELLLVCTRGSCTPETDKLEPQVQSIERKGRHSEKPEEFRALIDRLYPSGYRVELFRRGAAPKGWDVAGNEVQEAAG